MAASTGSPAISLILPAYNEVRSIGRTLDAMTSYLEARAWTYEIIVSADGDDGTRELVRERAQRDSRLHVLGSSERGGKGRGIRLAVAQACGEVIGFLDADYKVAIEEIEKILPCFEQGMDVVFGSRGMQETRIERKQKWFRRLGSKGFALLKRTLVGLNDVRDTQCGFKFFRRDVAKDIFSRQKIDGYMFDVEILCLAHAAGYRMKEVGVVWRDDGDTRLSLIAGNWQNLKDMFRIAWARHRYQPRTIPIDAHRGATHAEHERSRKAA